MRQSCDPGGPSNGVCSNTVSIRVGFLPWPEATGIKDNLTIMEVDMDMVRKAVLLVLFAFPTFLLAAQSVNINTADKATLMTIKGVGEQRAEAIVEYRQKHGPFKSVEQLSQVRGIGESIVDHNRDHLTVNQKR